jgi:hypothetical protein
LSTRKAGCCNIRKESNDAENKDQPRRRQAVQAIGHGQVHLLQIVCQSHTDQKKHQAQTTAAQKPDGSPDQYPGIAPVDAQRVIIAKSDGTNCQPSGLVYLPAAASNQDTRVDGPRGIVERRCCTGETNIEISHYSGERK